MKKFLIYILVFVLAFMFAWFLFEKTNRSNSLQQAYETDMQKYKFVLTKNLISDDIKCYYNNKDSVYGAVINIINDLEKFNSENKEVNIKYLRIVAEDFECIGRSNSEYCEIKKIVIYNDEYKKLLKETKGFVGLINNSIASIINN